MNRDDMFDQLFSVGGDPTDENWHKAAQLMLEHNIDTYELVQYINKVEPPETADWTYRAEMFETALYLKGAKEAVLKGDL